jgi:hypothetical protein
MKGDIGTRNVVKAVITKLILSVTDVKRNFDFTVCSNLFGE